MPAIDNREFVHIFIIAALRGVREGPMAIGAQKLHGPGAEAPESLEGD